MASRLANSHSRLVRIQTWGCPKRAIPTRYTGGGGVVGRARWAVQAVGPSSPDRPWRLCGSGAPAGRIHDLPAWWFAETGRWPVLAVGFGVRGDRVLQRGALTRFAGMVVCGDGPLGRIRLAEGAACGGSGLAWDGPPAYHLRPKHTALLWQRRGDYNGGVAVKTKDAP
jgi:hypothetical protein